MTFISSSDVKNFMNGKIYFFFTSRDEINVKFVKNLNFLFIINNFEAFFLLYDCT